MTYKKTTFISIVLISFWFLSVTVLAQGNGNGNNKGNGSTPNGRPFQYLQSEITLIKQQIESIYYELQQKVNMEDLDAIYEELVLIREEIADGDEENAGLIAALDAELAEVDYRLQTLDLGGAVCSDNEFVRGVATQDGHMVIMCDVFDDPANTGSLAHTWVRSSLILSPVAPHNAQLRLLFCPAGMSATNVEWIGQKDVFSYGIRTFDTPFGNYGAIQLQNTGSLPAFILVQVKCSLIV